MNVCDILSVMKICKRCKESKPLADFGFADKLTGRLRCNCRKCESIVVREYRTSHSEQINAARKLRWKENKDKNAISVKIYRERHKDKVRLANFKGTLKHKYNLTIEDYVVIRDRQNRCCGICKLPPRDGMRLLIDHDHRTGKVRGLLCQNCNVFIGMAYEDIAILTAAINYLGERRVSISPV